MDIFLLCLEIFLARILDVSLGTIKTFYVVREKRLIASIIAFFEVLIWFLVAREALNTDINSIVIPISYSLGFATGTYMGILLSSKLIHGNLTVIIISSKIKNKDINALKDKGFGLTSVKVNGNKRYLMIEIVKKDLEKLKLMINDIDENAFIIVNESKFTQNGFFAKS